MSRKYLLAMILFAVLFSILPQHTNAQQALQKTVDSLFVIASSGEIKYRDMVEPAIDKLAALGRPIVPLLIDKFTTKSARERLTVINILKKIGSPTVPDLISALSHPNGLVVQRVCWALGDIKDTSAVIPLIGVSNHSRWQVREQALGSLGDLKDTRAEQTVLNGYDDPIGQVRKAASVAAGKIGISKDIESLVHMLGDPFYGARMSAAASLVKLDTSKVIAVLADSLYSVNRLTSSLASKVLGELHTDESLYLLYEASKEMDVYLRTHAAVALVTADPDDLCGFQESVLQNETDRLSLLKIHSAIQAAKNEKKEPEK